MSTQGEPGATKSFKDTLNLPKTTFPMKANLVQNEPASLKRWAEQRLYARLRELDGSRPRGRFVFHDGPPYANGSIHLGHLLNKCLKDFVVRSRTMMGYDVPFVPGWDCHGLPIEHRVMTELVESGKITRLEELGVDERRTAVRRACRAYAEKYVKLHTSQMTQLLTLADYEDPYLTMTPAYEGATLEVLATLVERGLVYRDLKPVHWSVDNRTALADAELEYHDREDLSIYVDFEAEDPDAVYDAFGLPPHADDEDEAEADTDVRGKRPNQRPSFMIWTTTPWTLPANLAVAVHSGFVYALVKVDGNFTVIAEALVDKVTSLAKAEDVEIVATTSGEKLLGLRYRHPFVDRQPKSSEKVFTVVHAEYVTLEDGTGLVHTAPGHGTEDYQTGLREGLPIYCPVLEDGSYDPTAPDWLRGLSIWKANGDIVERLRESGHLFFDQKFVHSYPHDWRSKTPVIFRCTEQWFVGVDRAFSAGGDRPSSLRQRALAATSAPESVVFVPEWGRNRMRGMLESRPDWCISRQRAWGLPIPAFFDGEGRCLMTAASVRAVARVIREEGSDAWCTRSPSDLLRNYDALNDVDLPADLRGLDTATLSKGSDILDVWFESGSSWNSVMRERGLGYPIDLYLEGSDQHRGWFQLSLLPAMGVTGKPPFRALLTHGFVVDKDGKKLSKSRADAKDYDVENLLKDYGADVLRWWVSSLAYENDVRVDRSFFDTAGESYRKVRNTLRFMLSNLYDFTPSVPGANGTSGHCVPLSSISPTTLDAWMLSELDTLIRDVTAAYERFDFRAAHGSLHAFCNETLSAVYLAAVKDRLYCDPPDSERRRRTQTVLWDLTDALCKLLAPVLCHTADEAYRTLHANQNRAAESICVHREAFPRATGVISDPAWKQVMSLREQALTTLERSKSDLGVENPLDAAVVFPDPASELSRFDPVDLADLLGVSRVQFGQDLSEARVLDLRSEPRCERSRKRDGTVKARKDGIMLSDRDAAAVGLA